VCGEHGHGTVRHLIQLIDEHGATGAQILDHMAVMHNFVAHINRRAKFDQRAFHDVDRALHPGAEPAGLSQYDTHRLRGV
jgi:hypothetical protein